VKRSGREVLDPVVAYDRLAPVYGRLAERRRLYLQSIERLVVSRVPAGSRALLDVGTGDGVRARRIAVAAGLEDVVLLEPSSAMRQLIPSSTRVMPVRLQDLEAEPGLGPFHVITCLWNVLGHVHPAAARARGLLTLGSLLAPRGALFVDVNNRYNVRAYGFIRTAVRFLGDAAWPGESNGDVVVEWRLDAGKCSTTGHVFTQGEMRRLAEAAGLRIDERLSVDYDSGAVRTSAIEGNLLYVLRRDDPA
jgi:2-polyprenyl-3-methyl-5-hydroxy-6-metoxy-1,4-benzoquinol methylase